MMKLTTGYLLVSPLLGALVVVWALDPASGLPGVLVFVSCTILHSLLVWLNAYSHWDDGFTDGVRIQTHPSITPWDPESGHTTGVEE